ncbi:G-type lectin S-receptor-like serine/threonine-protein kinase At2g19130 [Pyrus x bretschneideri]|uniref:G-type lectin S-receptor-like serine/threonine-protein kinase At2g19130 n=1 Tax=Pyrus x bretschneideri TaxID=225117 RepID=UPI00202FCD6E|nr:G-type lectin S-receptor-like serine/threonine-protein kinase At2g19130 [Pyrus x bretschneideri]
MDSKTKPKPVLSAVFFGLLCLNVSLGADTITVNQSLSGAQTIVSPGGIFELGFFTPGNSSNFYIGMWYTKQVVSERTIVWVANREKPVSDRFYSVLKILDGNLVLLNESKTPVWSTSLTSTTTAACVQALLMDSGNLVLRARGSSNTCEQLLWRSFDHPAHTWLPGSKIGFNKITKQIQVLN